MILLLPIIVLRLLQLHSGVAERSQTFGSELLQLSQQVILQLRIRVVQSFVNYRIGALAKQLDPALRIANNHRHPFPSRRKLDNVQDVVTLDIIERFDLNVIGRSALENVAEFGRSVY